ncbi:MAG: hypothetical protein ABW127_13560 [Candidatus Thiodiazotropha endolucinida]
MPESKTQTTDRHPMHNLYVIAILPFGFVHHGKLLDLGNRFCLEDARNIRYWRQRDGGLPQLANQGFMQDPNVTNEKMDVIDEVTGKIHFESFICLYPSKSFKEEKHV